MIVYQNLKYRGKGNIHVQMCASRVNPWRDWIQSYLIIYIDHLPSEDNSRDSSLHLGSCKWSPLRFAELHTIWNCPLSVKIHLNIRFGLVW